MSGSRPNVNIRVSADGAEQARKQIEAIGPAGEAAMRRINAASAAAAPEMQKLATASDVVQRSFVGLGGSLGRIGAVFTGVSGVAAGMTAGFLALGAAAGVGAVQIAKAGDAAAATMARLTSAAGGLGQAQTVYESLFKLSQQTGVAVTESAGSFSRFSVAAKEIGATNDQVLRLVAGIQKAGLVSGASAQEAGAAVQQLGQALASGTLQGDELRSVLENMPQFAQALARELGVSIGALRQMGSEGKLTADVVFPAMLKAAEKMGTEFDKMPKTMSMAASILGEATTDFLVKLDRIVGASGLFRDAMLAGANAINSASAIIAPNDRQRAEAGVATSTGRIADLERRIAELRERSPANMGFTLPEGSALVAGRDRQRGEMEASLAKEQEALRQHQAMLRLIENDARRQRGEDASAAEVQRQLAARESATKRLKETAAELDDRYKARAAYEKKIKELDEDEARNGALPAGVTFSGLRKQALEQYTEALAKAAKEEAKGGEEARKAAEKRREVIETLDAQVAAAERAYVATTAGTAGSRELAIALEVENKLRAAGIPAIEKRTEAEKAAAQTIEARVRSLDAVKEAEKKYEEQAKKTKEFGERSWNELASIGERAMDRLGDAIVNAFTSGNGAAINFGNIAKGILGSVVSDIAKLGIINPILNSLFTSSTGPRATLSGAFGGSATSIGGTGGFSLGSLGGIGSLSSLLPSSWTSGISGIGSSIFGTAGVSPATASLFGDVSGIGASAISGTPGLLGTYGTSLMGGSALTLGGALSGIGMGMGAGSLINGLLGGNQTNGMIGSALGSIGGFLIGGPLGGLIGGAAGGGLGGLIGPGKTVNSYGLRLQSAGFTENGANDFAGSLVPVSRQYYDEAGAAQFQQADQVVAAVNAYLSANNLQVAGASIVGGNKNGPDGSGFGTVGEAFANLAFRSTDNAKLSAYLGTQTFDDPAKLQAAVDGFKQAEAAIAALGAETVPAFTASLKAVNDNFDQGVEAARKYGLAEDNLTTARAKALAALEAQRTETLRQSDVALSIRRLAAGGDSQGAELARQAESARQEVDSFTKSLDALAITAEDRAARLVALEEVQAAERAAIIARFGEQAAASLRTDLAAGQNLLRELAFGGSSALAPEQKYFAAMSTLSQAQRDLDAGGSLASYTSVASQVLPVARDFLGTSQRYAGLAAQVGQVLASKGADGGGLAQMLSAQAGGFEGLAGVYAAYGDATVSELKSLRTAFDRMNATLEALITRRSAAA